MTNQRNRDENFLKFGHRSIPMGIPRISRLDTRPIAVLHETPRVTVVGRNYCNGFSSNQFLLIHRPTNECIFVDAGDDWPDDWIAFLKSSRLNPTHIFLTHCHIDNVINLNALLEMVKREMGIRMGVMWNPEERPWIDAFPRACERYGRIEEMRQPLPLLYRSGSFYTPPERRSVPGSSTKRPLIGRRPRTTSSEDNDEAMVEHFFPDMLLSSATNRSTSFYEFGPHTPLHYICTPGHSPGHTMLYLARERLLFSGDLICYNQVGRVDLPWATGSRLAESLLGLGDFPDETVLLPGHGRLTTLGRERRHNKALQVLYSRKSDQPQQEVSVGFNAGYL